MNAELESEIIKVDNVFKKELEDIKRKKIENGTWKNVSKPLSLRRITKAMRNLNNWNDIKIRIIEARFENE